MLRKVWVLLVAAAIVAGACAGDDSDAATDEASPTSTLTVSETEPSVGSESPSNSLPLPASFRGVTETSIKVGVVVPDFDALQAAGVPNYHGSAETAFQAFFDVINSEGGIFGRQIDPVYVSFDFLDNATQDTACAELTEDHEVFIALYGLLTGANLCFTELHDTMVMTRGNLTAEWRERSDDTLWLALNAAEDERLRLFGEALASSGRLDGKTVGILVATADNDGLEGRELQQTLSDLGIESTLLLTTAPQDDQVARDRELTLYAERFRSQGVDFLFDLWGGANVAGVFADAGFTPELAYKALGPSIDGAVDRSLLDGAISIAERDEQSMLDDPDFQANCMDVVRAANPDLVDEMAFLPTGDQQAAGQRNWVLVTMIACDQTMLLKQLGELAGADLTNDSFRAALDQLGPVDLHGYGQASFDSEAKWDGTDEFSLQEYNFASDSIVVVGDPIIVDR